MRAYSLFLAGLLITSTSAFAGDPPIRLLFLGDNGHHQPMARFRELQPVLEKHGTQTTHTDALKSLNPATLAKFDGLVVYANHTKLASDQEAALLDYVASGKGFIPLHCASACFGNSEKYIELVGARFKSHGTGTFKTTLAASEHPILKGYAGFTSFDETYVHDKHNEKDRTVLEYRADKKGKEPWTWVRAHGKGRVFYTAWGHDERTWTNAGFHDLIERGVRWATGNVLSQSPVHGTAMQYRDRPEMTTLAKDAKPFEYKDAKIPFYAPKFGVKGPLTKMQLPLAPAESMKHIVHPTDFELKLFVSEPKIKRPICMNWDERGRLWIAESVDYPNNRQPQGQGSDRITICEDTDGDGVADKFTVFADKLSIPTSFVFAQGGIIVTQAPHTLFLRSTKGNDVADERKILFSGWGAGDTHAGPSNLHYGFDGWIYGIVGYSGFNGAVGGESHKFSQGFFRFKLSETPASAGGVSATKLEFLRSTSNNSWGVGWTEEGLLFGSTANGNPSVFLPIPNRYYEKVKGLSAGVLPMIATSNKFYPVTDKVRQVDYHGGFTAAAGHAIYTARTYPKEYWNRVAFVTEPTGHLVASFVLNKSGSTFSSKNSWNLLASDDEWCAPIMAEVGPDGNVWVIDWYNYIVQHNPTPPGFKNGKGNAYETDLRDKVHGRIYRLVAKNGQPAPPFDLKNAKPDELVAALKSDNLFWRKHAQRLLIERGANEAVPALVKLVRDRSVDEIGLNGAAVNAIWTLHGLGAFKLDPRFESDACRALEASLRHPAAGVRRNAVLALPTWPAALETMLAAGVHEDVDPQVRLAAFLKMTEMVRFANAGRFLTDALTRNANLDDRALSDAISMAAAHNSASFLTGAAANKAMTAPRAMEILAAAADHHARTGGAVDAGLLASLADANPKTAEVILAGLAKGAPRGAKAKLDGDAEKALVQLMPRLQPAARAQMLQLTKLWGSTVFEKQAAEITKTLIATLTDAKEADAQRIDAARQLMAFPTDDAKLLDTMLDVITPRSSPMLVLAILEAAGSSATPELGASLLKRMATFTPQARSVALRILLSRTETTRQFLDAVEKGSMTFSELALDQKQALAAHTDKAIAERAKALLAKGGGLPNADRQKVVEEFVSVIKKSGSVEQGKAVFKKHCAVCHTHSGEGTKIGPDLSGVAVHTKEHLLIDILDPSRSVEGNYRVYAVETKAGLSLSGLLESETKTTIELFNTEGKKVVVERDDIEALVASKKSLMPEGFEKSLKQDELIDLLTFLTAFPRFVPVALEKSATIASTKGMFYSKDATVERLILPDWSPRTVKGVPFHFVDPGKDDRPNVIMLYSKIGKVAETMPKAAKVEVKAPAKAIHLLSGVSGWGSQSGKTGGVALIVRLHYADGKTEDHPLRDGEHFADYIRKIDVPKSEFAFSMRKQQMRYLSVTPSRDAVLAAIEFVKGPDPSAPIVLAVTVETK